MTSYKALAVPFEHIAAQPDTQRCYRLSDRTVALLLTQTEYLLWRTRWLANGRPLAMSQWETARHWAFTAINELKAVACVHLLL
ncbi:MAG: hypothetical protein SNJ83_10695, partial [Aggregatilineales bacterium]